MSADPVQKTTQAASFTNGKRRGTQGHMVSHGIHWLTILIFIFPLYWLVVSSFKTLDSIFVVPFDWIPRTWTLDNYSEGWKYLGNVTFGRIFLNTFFVTIMTVLGTLLTSTLVAFGFARIPFKGRNFWFLVLLATMMLPSQVTLVPNYLIFDFLNLIDSFLVLYIGAFFGGGAFFIFLIRQFIMGIPLDLDESARVDGASTFRIYWQIILPLCGPVVATVVIFSFSWSYNDFFTPLIYLNSIEKFTVPVAIRSFLDEAGAGNVGASLAMTVLSIVPLFVVFSLAQKYFVQGIMTTGLKG